MISQTNRTILFDVINPEVDNLSVLMTDVDEGVSSLTDDKIVEINERLLVNSFDDFLVKFKPTIYSYFDTDNKPIHTLIKPTDVAPMLVKEIVIDKSNRILKMFIRMMDDKKKSKKTNIAFNYEEVTKMLAPEKTIDEIKKIKQEIQYLEKANARLEKDSPAKKDAVKKLVSKYESTVEYYSETSAQIALMAGMLKQSLLAAEKEGPKDPNKSGYALPAIEGGSLTSLTPDPEFVKQKLLGFSSGAAKKTELLEGAIKEVDDTMETSVSIIKDGENKTKALVAPARVDYSQYTKDTLESFYDNSMTEYYSTVGYEYDPEKAAFTRNLVLNAFTDRPSKELMEMSIAEKAEKYNQYTYLYAEWQKSFMREAKALIEKLLNIKAYFDQYHPKLPKTKPTLLIVNSPLEDIIEAKYTRQLQQYLESVNNKIEYGDAIWFGIVPNIRFSENSMGTDINRKTYEDLGYTGDFEEGTKFEPSEMDNLQILLDSIKKYRIQTFFSFEANDDTTFAKLGTQGIDRYIEKTEDIANNPECNKFAIVCLPNFTVIPRDRGKVVYGSWVKVEDFEEVNSEGESETKSKVMFSKDREESFKFWIHGVYVSAAFVAAGLAASWQCSNYLKSRFEDAKDEKGNKIARGKVSGDLPGVRFDIEASNHSQIVTATFTREFTGITNDDRKKLNENNFGFVFSSDKLGNVTVFKSRSLFERDGSYTSIFKETTITYILREMKRLSNDNKEELLILYGPGNQVKQWELAKGYINSILAEKDFIGNPEFEDGTSKIQVKFGGTAEYINIEVISNDD